MGYFFYFLSLYAAPYVKLYNVLAFLNFIFLFQSSLSAAQNSRFWPDT